MPRRYDDDEKDVGGAEGSWTETRTSHGRVGGTKGQDQSLIGWRARGPVTFETTGLAFISVVFGVFYPSFRHSPVIYCLLKVKQGKTLISEGALVSFHHIFLQ